MRPLVAAITGLTAFSAAAQVSYQLKPGPAPDAAQLEDILAKAKPALRRLKQLPDRALADPTGGAAPGSMGIRPGSDGPADGTAPSTRSRTVQEAPAAEEMPSAPKNYGAGNYNTIYHYTDSRVDKALMTANPWRKAGLLTVKRSTGDWQTCTAALIDKSIIVTAGNCLHDGGNRGNGWIQNGWFYPGRSGNTNPYGRARVRWVTVTDQWFNTGDLDYGYDVGIAVLAREKTSGDLIGNLTGFFGLCFSNCLQNYWFMTQLGYSSNYYNGKQMADSQHLEASDGWDFRYGTGMRGSSSGGPHVANLGPLKDKAADAGQWPWRNVIFAVTSWAFTNGALKMQGASPLSGPNNNIGFKAMFNAACRFSKRKYGANSCQLI